MSVFRPLSVLLLFVILAGLAWLWLSGADTPQDWNERKARFQAATVRAMPLVRAIEAYVADVGHSPTSLDDVVPDYLPALPATGLPECGDYEYRSLTHKQGSIVWYDLGSRQGAPYSGESRYSEGEPGHAILVFNLDSKGQITSALLDRMPGGREAEPFDPERWKAGGDRIGLALALSDTYRLHGMPRDVFVELLGPPDGSRTVKGAAWELRLNCPTGLLNHDAFVYWPTQSYPQRLYGGRTELINGWAYVHS